MEKDNSYLMQYYKAYKNGDVVLGQDMALQLENLIADLDCGLYVYDTRAAHFRIAFIENFIKHTKSPYTGQPFLLELWQKAFIEAFYSFLWEDEAYLYYYGEAPPKKGLRRFKKAILLVARKNGKPLGIDTPIKTLKGWKPLREVMPGDYVFDENLEPVQVIAVTGVMEGLPCFELTLSGGEKVIAEAGHMWPVFTDKGELHTLPTQAIYYNYLNPQGKTIYHLPTPGKQDYQAITCVKHAKSVPVKCIEVASEGGLFVAGKDFLTHNSTLCSALLLTELMIGNPGSEIVCSSNDDSQARILFNEAGVMRALFDPKGKRTHQNLVEIRNKTNYSKMFRLSERTRNKEGRNIDAVAMDEAHEMLDNSMAEPLIQSQSGKDEPIFITITSEGFVNDGYLDTELQYARKVLKGEKEDPTLLSFLYTNDSENEIWQDESSWGKSNPSLGTVKKRRYLIDSLTKAKEDKASRVFVLTKDFNWKMSNSSAWLVPEEYENPATFHINDMRGTIGIGGIDLSETTDLCAAFCMIMRPEDNTKYFLQRYFIPETKIEQGLREDKKNYLDWARQDLLYVTPGNENDYTQVTKWYISLVKTFGIKIFKIGLDRWNAQYLMAELTDTGFDCEKVKMEFGLSNAMKGLEADFRSKHVNYQDNPITKWNLGNIGLKIDEAGRIAPVKIKDKANRRIDGGISMLICNCLFQKHRSTYLQMIS